ncbi:MAG: hypothetical protein FWH41_01080 [Treponema sp.]|nr:hypothetical protein [Treponema sp.]
MKIQGERKEIILNDNIEELFENLPKEKMKEILMSIPQEECLKLLKMNGVL